MPLQPANMLATGYIVANRFVMIDPTTFAGQASTGNTTLGGLGGFHIIQSCITATANPTSTVIASTTWSIGAGYPGDTIGISADGTNYPPINDPTIFGSTGPTPVVAAAPGQWLKIFSWGSSDVLLEMGLAAAGVACNPGDFLFPTSGTGFVGNYPALTDPYAGKGYPLTTHSTVAQQGVIWYGARALQACTGVIGEKIRVEVIGGFYTRPTTP